NDISLRIVDTLTTVKGTKQQVEEPHMTGAYAQNWPGRGAWASRGAGFTAEWSEREGRGGPDREGRDAAERGERRGRKGHRHHHHHRDAANWLFSRGGGGRHGGRATPSGSQQLTACRRR